MIVLQILIHAKHYQHETLELSSLRIVPIPFHPNRKFLEEKHAYIWTKPQHDTLAISILQYLALDSKLLPNYREFSTPCYFKKPSGDTQK